MYVPDHTPQYCTPSMYVPDRTPQYCTPLPRRPAQSTPAFLLFESDKIQAREDETNPTPSKESSPIDSMS